MSAALAEKPFSISAPKTVTETAIDLTNYEPFANRKRWTRASCEFLERVGEMPARYELLDGEIIDKMVQNMPHGISVMKAILWLANVYGGQRIQSQISVNVAEADQATNDPEPDVMVLERSASEYGRRPLGTDLILIVEVSDTTLRDDLTKKASLYARAGIPEYWVIDVNSRRLIAHRDRTETGYAVVTTHSEDDSLAPVSASESSVRIGDLLPPVGSAAV